MTFFSRSSKDKVHRIMDVSDFYFCLTNEIGWDPLETKNDVEVMLEVSSVENPTAEDVIVYRGILGFPAKFTETNKMEVIFYEPNKLEILDIPMGWGFTYKINVKSINCRLEMWIISDELKNKIESEIDSHIKATMGDSTGQPYRITSMKLFAKRSYRKPYKANQQKISSLATLPAESRLQEGVGEMSTKDISTTAHEIRKRMSAEKINSESTAKDLKNTCMAKPPFTTMLLRDVYAVMNTNSNAEPSGKNNKNKYEEKNQEKALPLAQLSSSGDSLSHGSKSVEFSEEIPEKGDLPTEEVVADVENFEEDKSEIILSDVPDVDKFVESQLSKPNHSPKYESSTQLNQVTPLQKDSSCKYGSTDMEKLVENILSEPITSPDHGDTPVLNLETLPLKEFPCQFTETDMEDTKSSASPKCDSPSEFNQDTLPQNEFPCQFQETDMENSLSKSSASPKCENSLKLNQETQKDLLNIFAASDKENVAQLNLPKPITFLRCGSIPEVSPTIQAQTNSQSDYLIPNMEKLVENKFPKPVTSPVHGSSPVTVPPQDLSCNYDKYLSNNIEIVENNFSKPIISPKHGSTPELKQEIVPQKELTSQWTATDIEDRMLNSTSPQCESTSELNQETISQKDFQNIFVISNEENFGEFKLSKPMLDLSPTGHEQTAQNMDKFVENQLSEPTNSPKHGSSPQKDLLYRYVSTDMENLVEDIVSESVTSPESVNTPILNEDTLSQNEFPCQFPETDMENVSECNQETLPQKDLPSSFAVSDKEYVSSPILNQETLSENEFPWQFPKTDMENTLSKSGASAKCESNPDLNQATLPVKDLLSIVIDKLKLLPITAPKYGSTPELNQASHEQTDLQLQCQEQNMEKFVEHQFSNSITSPKHGISQEISQEIPSQKHFSCQCPATDMEISLSTSITSLKHNSTEGLNQEIHQQKDFPWQYSVTDTFSKPITFPRYGSTPEYQGTTSQIDIDIEKLMDSKLLEPVVSSKHGSSSELNQEPLQQKDLSYQFPSTDIDITFSKPITSPKLGSTAELKQETASQKYVPSDIEKYVEKSFLEPVLSPQHGSTEELNHEILQRKDFPWHCSATDTEITFSRPITSPKYGCTPELNQGTSQKDLPCKYSSDIEKLVENKLLESDNIAGLIQPDKEKLPQKDTDMQGAFPVKDIENILLNSVTSPQYCNTPDVNPETVPQKDASDQSATDNLEISLLTSITSPKFESIPQQNQNNIPQKDLPSKCVASDKENIVQDQLVNPSTIPQELHPTAHAQDDLQSKYLAPNMESFVQNIVAKCITSLKCGSSPELNKDVFPQKDLTCQYPATVTSPKHGSSPEPNQVTLPEKASPCKYLSDTEKSVEDKFSKLIPSPKHGSSPELNQGAFPQKDMEKFVENKLSEPINSTGYESTSEVSKITPSQTNISGQNPAHDVENNILKYITSPKCESIPQFNQGAIPKQDLSNKYVESDDNYVEAELSINAENPNGQKDSESKYLAPHRKNFAENVVTDVTTSVKYQSTPDLKQEVLSREDLQSNYISPGIGNNLASSPKSESSSHLNQVTVLQTDLTCQCPVTDLKNSSLKAVTSSKQGSIPELKQKTIPQNVLTCKHVSTDIIIDNFIENVLSMSNTSQRSDKTEHVDEENCDSTAYLQQGIIPQKHLLEKFSSTPKNTKEAITEKPLAAKFRSISEIEKERITQKKSPVKFRSIPEIETRTVPEKYPLAKFRSFSAIKKESNPQKDSPAKLSSIEIKNGTIVQGDSLAKSKTIPGFQEGTLSQKDSPTNLKRIPEINNITILQKDSKTKFGRTPEFENGNMQQKDFLTKFRNIPEVKNAINQQKDSLKKFRSTLEFEKRKMQQEDLDLTQFRSIPEVQIAAAQQKDMLNKFMSTLEFEVRKIIQIYSSEEFKAIPEVIIQQKDTLTKLISITEEIEKTLTEQKDSLEKFIRIPEDKNGITQLKDSLSEFRSTPEIQKSTIPQKTLLENFSGNLKIQKGKIMPKESPVTDMENRSQKSFTSSEHRNTPQLNQERHPQKTSPAKYFVPDMEDFTDAKKQVNISPKHQNNHDLNQEKSQQNCSSDEEVLPDMDSFSDETSEIANTSRKSAKPKKKIFQKTKKVYSEVKGFFSRSNQTKTMEKDGNTKTSDSPNKAGTDKTSKKKRNKKVGLWKNIRSAVSAAAHELPGKRKPRD